MVLYQETRFFIHKYIFYGIQNRLMGFFVVFVLIYAPKTVLLPKNTKFTIRHHQWEMNLHMTILPLYHIIQIMWWFWLSIINAKEVFA